MVCKRTLTTKTINAKHWPIFAALSAVMDSRWIVEKIAQAAINKYNYKVYTMLASEYNRACNYQCISVI